MDTVVHGAGSAAHQLAPLLESLSTAFDGTVAAVASRCAVGGKLDAAQMDQHQWVCYELALACADLLAARNIVESSARSALDEELGRTFACEAAGAVLARLRGMHDALALDDGHLDRVSTSSAYRTLRRAAGCTEVLARLGAALADSDLEIGDVELDDQTALARDAFRRFAADVVAPMAEEIHRKDLTVPEALLQPLREMGVFGLSIPEEFGGSAPQGHDNTPMMIAVTEALSEASLAAAGSLITRPEILARALLAGGTEAQKRHWLPKLAAGDPLCAISITEPDYGSDVASLALRARPTPGGWLLNGAKTWCTFAGKAGVLMVVARTNPDRSLGHRGLSVFLVEKPSFEGHEFGFVRVSW
jgi:(2S)-methylsuccinyl-CoA dehydrogenase